MGMVRALRTWKAAIAAFVFMVVWLAALNLPRADYWFVPISMIVPDVPHEGDVILFVEREIRRPAVGRWVVTVRRATEGGWTLHCPPAHGQSDYKPDSIFPEPLTLEWWTEGQCSVTEPGRYFISTTWWFDPDWLPGERRTPPLVSNVFTVTEVDE